ncbi:hypothetical protein Dimus_025289 [Dionaea muscipula]
MQLLPLFIVSSAMEMEKKLLISSSAKTLLTLTLFLLSLQFSRVSSFSRFSPPDHYLINCGSAAAATADPYNRRFTGDESSASGSVFFSGTGTISLRNPNPNPSEDSSLIYHTTRIFTRPSKYVFPVRDRGTHFVRLHFHPFNSSKLDLSHAQFHVLAHHTLLLHNFNGVSLRRNTEIREYILWIDGEKLDISFIPWGGKSRFAFVSAIEVISAPKDLILSTAQFVDSHGVVKFNGISRVAFEMMYRVNVGGSKVTPFNDSLWRTWIPDDQFLNSADGLETNYFTGRINYRLGGASREVAPDNVYNSARVITSPNATIPRLNMTWSFPVVEGYQYLVRAHFCDIKSIALGLLYFNVYVNGNLAYENLDLSTLAFGMLASPFYADFVVNVGDSRLITVTVGPSNWSIPNAVDAILNGLEILKLNNSLGSLDGDVSPMSILKSCLRGDISVLIPLVAAICLFVAASVVLCKGKFDIGHYYVAWSPLPLDISEVDLKSINREFGRKMGYV